MALPARTRPVTEYDQPNERMMFGMDAPIIVKTMPKTAKPARRKR